MELVEMVSALETAKVGDLVSKAGLPPMTVEKVVGDVLHLRTHLGVLLPESIEKLRRYGYDIVPPSKPTGSPSRVTPAAEVEPEKLAMEDSTAQPPLGETGLPPSDTAGSARPPNPVPPSAPAEPEVTPAPGDTVTALKLEMEAEVARIQEKYQKKMLEAMKKAKPLGQRRQEALETMDKLRDLVRAARGDVLMSDEDADAIIIQAVAELDEAVNG